MEDQQALLPDTWCILAKGNFAKTGMAEVTGEKVGEMIQCLDEKRGAFTLIARSVADWLAHSPAGHDGGNSIIVE